jgi:hypothetical protein
MSLHARARIVCFCPSSRLSLAALVLSTWHEVEQFVLTEQDPRTIDVSEFSAVIVMDEFVTAQNVAALHAHLPVIVLAWNGLFEIDRYRAVIGDDVLYVGTDAELASGAPVRYQPFIRASCPYSTWRELYRTMRQFSVVGDVTYRIRWLRTRALAARAVSVLFSIAGAMRRPHALRRTVESGLIRDKLVWAGNCYLDFAAIGVAQHEQQVLEQRIENVRRISDASTRLAEAVTLIRDWLVTAQRLGPDRAHQGFYVTNTLLRWAVLDYFRSTARSSTWFFGRDNLGLGLELELYVHNLVPNTRTAFLEFGGKTAATALYPRSLHLIARQYYVVPVTTDRILPIVQRVERGLQRPAQFFSELEGRRRALYRDLGSSDLSEAQRRVWADFVD